MATVLSVLSGLTVLRNTTGVVVEVTSHVPSLSASVAPETTMMLFVAAVPESKLNVTVWLEESAMPLGIWAAKFTV